MKTLWIKKSVPDTHVHSTFLSQLKHNQNVVKYEYKTLIFDSSGLLVNINTGIIFILSFVAIYLHNFDPRIFVAVATAPDLILLHYFMQTLTWKQILATTKSNLVILFAMLSLTPVFRSLTESTSSDSIWALSGWLLLLNITMSSRSFPALSTNTALAAIIVLASRLRTSQEVFFFILFNTQIFVALPFGYKWMKLHDSHSHTSCYLVACFISLCSSVLVQMLFGWLIMVIWGAIQLLILLGLPALFLSLQQYKDRISGPWDPAKPDLS